MFSVQIQSGSNGRITNVYCGGRPKKLFDREGDHTTAWHLITEGIDNVLRGCTLPEAFEVMMGLCNKLANLPGTKIGNRLEGSLGERFATANSELNKHYGLAAKTLEIVRREREEQASRSLPIIKDVQPTQSLRLSLLQHFVRAYLEQHYVIPLSIVYLQLAHGKGEPSRLAKLRGYSDMLAERPTLRFTPEQSADLRVNMWGLLDIQTVAELSIANQGFSQSLTATLNKLAQLTNIPGIANLSELPNLGELMTLSKKALNPTTTRQETLTKFLKMAPLGTALTLVKASSADTVFSSDLMYIDREYGTAPERLAASLAQHLLTLATGWPQIYEKSGIATAEAVEAFLLKHGCDPVLGQATLRYLSGVKDLLRKENVAIQKIEQEYSLEEVVLKDQDEDGNTVARPGALAVQLSFSPEAMVMEARQGGRPEPTFGSALGDHTTAWTVIESGMQLSVLELPMNKAMQNVFILCEEALALPGNQLFENLSEQHKARYEQAKRELADLAKLSRGPGGTESLSLLENSIRTYLAHGHLW